MQALLLDLASQVVRASAMVWPCDWRAKSMTVVVPPTAAAMVPVV